MPGGADAPGPGVGRRLFGLGLAALVFLGAAGCHSSAARTPATRHALAARQPRPAPLSPPRVVTAGWPRAVPPFAFDAEALLSELEAWRGVELEGDLLVETVRAVRVSAETPCRYEPTTKRLLVPEGGTGNIGRDDLMLVFVHALQDERFELARLQDRARDADAARALHALIEGEARFAVSELLPYEIGHEIRLPLRGPISPEVFDDFFNREAGHRFVRALHEAGGWQQVDAAFRNPPQRTAEVLEPSRYLGNTRARDEEQLFTAWRLTSFVVGEYEPLGAYDVQRLLARSEQFRPRAQELASKVVAGKSVRGAKTVWMILLSDAAAAPEMLSAASAAGATGAEAPSPDARMVSFSPPEGFELSAP